MLAEMKSFVLWKGLLHGILHNVALPSNPPLAHFVLLQRNVLSNCTAHVECGLCVVRCVGSTF